ncbi:hypothetical protein [Sphingobacterium sp. UDSM-2020]|uniref:hypothetical protein n=1 Tax=Sphingobacterium sp. UDSM-2020 TaxID=2795738 RepID=UPI0019369D13|nr:hypothetical protein [Sphingobacterium sp. UDSM-2020]QQD11924.1 hypothetical protein JAZ75_14960 [Sphingobacterium sp. UDSM-2020]
MYKTMISLCILTLLGIRLSAQTQIKFDKKFIDIIEGREIPKSADSASQKYFENTLKVFKIECNKNIGFTFFPVGKRSLPFIYSKNSNIVIDYPSYNLISKDSMTLIAISWYNIIERKEESKRFKNYYEDYNDNLFKNISGINEKTKKEVKITERKNEPNYQYYNADRTGDFQILSNEPLYYLNYKYLTSYYILKKDVGYFRIYKFVKDDHVHKDDDMDIPKLFKFK